MILTTIERMEVISKAENLAAMVIQSEAAEEYRRCLYRLKHDQEAQQLISEFVKLKDYYEEVQRFGKYHPDYKTISKKMRELKRKLDLHDSIATFKIAENNVQALLDEIGITIGRAVSPQIKVQTGSPFFDTGGVGGGCGAGGACGCH